MSKVSASNSVVMTALAILSLVADILGIIGFFASGTFLQVGAGQWWISLGFVLGFLLAGIAMLAFGSRGEELVEWAVSIFGAIYSVIAIAYYGWFGWCFTSHPVAFWDFVGHTVAYAFFGTVGATATIATSLPRLRWYAYLLGFTNLGLAISVASKYMIHAQHMAWGTFVGELAILTVGAVAFVAAIVASEDAR